MNVELDDPGRRDNILLLPGDSMVVPEYKPVVVVQSAVTTTILPKRTLHRSR